MSIDTRGETVLLILPRNMGNEEPDSDVEAAYLAGWVRLTKEAIFQNG